MIKYYALPIKFYFTKTVVLEHWIDNNQCDKYLNYHGQPIIKIVHFKFFSQKIVTYNFGTRLCQNGFSIN